MAGTKAGGKKAAAKNLAKNPNFYREIGRKGGLAGRTGGFASDVTCNCDEYPEGHLLRKCAGRKGGRVSRRVSRKEASQPC